ncbi:hypothetical protein [Mesorhizobium sp. L2C085B000]|uniref:hypothetical protein n=1 Tax=Mesorhizobium sp. L2C085B000 TaxID=1287117 RepID=UPI0012DC9605|nr:hypothetical protein [Mesorhizobium sp. L2C085B000]
MTLESESISERVMRKAKSAAYWIVITLRNAHHTLTALTGGDGARPSRLQQNLDSSDFLCYTS